MLKKHVVLNLKLTLLINNFNFSELHEQSFRSSCSQIFLKVGVLKETQKLVFSCSSCEYCKVFERKVFYITP